MYVLMIAYCSFAFLLISVLLGNILICTFQDGWTPLHLAVQARRTDIVKLLLIKGADKTLKNQVRINQLKSTFLIIY